MNIVQDSVNASKFVSLIIKSNAKKYFGCPVNKLITSVVHETKAPPLQ